MNRLRNILKSFRFQTQLFKRLVLLLLCPLSLQAEVELNLDLVHGYSAYYPMLSITATNPAPTTFHRVESPSGLIWSQTDSGEEPSMSPTNDLAYLINECTNGLWSLTLNVGDASETNYAFAVSIDNVTTGLFGDITISYPAADSSITNRFPDFQWTSTSQLPQINVAAYDIDHTASYGAVLPTGSTNWTPFAELALGENRFYPRYSSNNFAGITFTVPTNTVDGLPLNGWQATADVRTYAIQKYTIVEPIPEIEYGASFALSIQRDASNHYHLIPDLINPEPAAITLHEITSPNGLCSATESTSISAEFLSLDDLVAECEDGDWTLEFDKGSASNRIYSFRVELNGIDTNTLTQTLILSPADGTTNHFGNPLMAWTGPTNFNSLSVSINNTEIQVPSTTATLPSTQTSWSDAPALAQGTNTFSITYIYDSYPGITASWPTNQTVGNLDIWLTSGQLTTTTSSSFEVKTGSAPYDVLSFGMNDGDFSLFFTPRLFPDFSYTLLGCTNLVEGNWYPISSFSGTGAPLLFSPAESNAAAYYRILLNLDL
jgi:hypothetical protein